ncbi:MAG: hypothetical protein Kow0063_02930 [Anaerolineae bacterium]
MTDATGGQLDRAYDLIRQDRAEEAIPILQAVLLNDSRNADAWWLWANAVSEPEEAREALHKVLEYNPDHAQAREMLAQLDELYPPVPEESGSGMFDFEFEEGPDFESLVETAEHEAVPEGVAAPPSALPEALPPAPGGEVAGEEQEVRIQQLAAETEEATPAIDFGSLFDEEGAGTGDIPPFEEMPAYDLEEEEEEETEARLRRRPVLRTLLIALVILVFAVGVAVVLLQGGGPSAPAPTSPTAAAQVLEPSAAMQTVLEAAQNALTGQSELLGGTPTVHLEARNGSPSLIITICRPARPDLPDALNIAMEMAARYGVSVQDEIAIVGVDIINCERNDLLMGATAPIEQAVAFASGYLSSEEYRAAWEWTS